MDPLWEQVGSQRSPYEYTFSNPVRYIDPTGMGPDDGLGTRKEARQVAREKNTQARENGSDARYRAVRVTQGKEGFGYTRKGSNSARALTAPDWYKNRPMPVDNTADGVSQLYVRPSTPSYSLDGTVESRIEEIAGRAQGGGVRMPDFYTLNISIAIPTRWTGTSLGWNGSFSIDRHGQIFLSPFGLGVGKSVKSGSASLTGNWMLQSNKPTPQETYNFLSGHGISVGGGFYGGVNWAISPTNSGTKNALGVGIYSPQIGASYNYTPDKFLGIPLILNKK